MKQFIATLLLLLAWPATAAELSGSATAEVGEVVSIRVDGAPAFDGAKTVAENLDVFRGWLASTRFESSAPEGAKSTVTTKTVLTITAEGIVPETTVQFTADRPGVYVVAALIPPELALHRIDVGGVVPPSPGPDPPNPPGPPGPGKVTAATWVYEKDQGAVPRHVLAAFQRINESGIRATTFEEDTVDGDGQVPDQYQAALEAARKAGLPALVVESNGSVVRVLRNPETLEQVLEAVQ